MPTTDLRANFKRKPQKGIVRGNLVVSGSLSNRNHFKLNRAAALAEWRRLEAE